MAEGEEHLTLKRKIEKEFKRKGYETEKEKTLENGLIVDVYAFNENETLLIEVGTLNGEERIDTLTKFADRVIHLPQIGKSKHRKYGSELDSVELDYIIKRVYERSDGLKYITVPKDSKIEAGDYVKLEKVEE